MSIHVKSLIYDKIEVTIEKLKEYGIIYDFIMFYQNIYLNYKTIYAP